MLLRNRFALGRYVAVLVAIVLITIVPLKYSAESASKDAMDAVETAVKTLIDNVRAKKAVSHSDYNGLVRTLKGLGGYEADIVISNQGEAFKERKQDDENEAPQGDIGSTSEISALGRNYRVCHVGHTYELENGRDMGCPYCRYWKNTAETAHDTGIDFETNGSVSESIRIYTAQVVEELDGLYNFGLSSGLVAEEASAAAQIRLSDGDVVIVSVHRQRMSLTDKVGQIFGNDYVSREYSASCVMGD